MPGWWRVRPRCWNSVPSAHGARLWVALVCALGAGASLPRHWPHGFAPVVFTTAYNLLYPWLLPAGIPTISVDDGWIGYSSYELVPNQLMNGPPILSSHLVAV